MLHLVVPTTAEGGYLCGCCVSRGSFNAAEKRREKRREQFAVVNCKKNAFKDRALVHIVGHQKKKKTQKSVYREVLIMRLLLVNLLST